MKKNLLVSVIMTKNVVFVDSKQPLNIAERLMRKHKIRHIPVIAEDKLVGMLSLTDLKRLSFVDLFGDSESMVDNVIFDMLGIEQVMIGNPICVKIDQTIQEVAEVLAQNEFHALPVIDGDKLAGIVTTTDLIRFLLDNY